MRYHASVLAALILVGSAVAASSLACSSDDKGSSSGSASNCGPGPYVKILGHVAEATASGTSRPKEDVVITFDVCADKKFTSDADGNVTANMTKGLAGPFRAEHPDDIPSYYGEWATSTDFEGTIGVVPKLFQGIVAPDFTAENTFIAFTASYPTGSFDAGVPDGGPTDPCLRGEGITVTIPDHPEAKIVYFTTDAVPKPDPAAKATSTNGIASITGLPDGISISPQATKPGCKITATHDGFTGRAVLHKGYGVIMTLLVTK